MPLTAGARLGPYEIVSPLGAGGMGEVYRARDTRLDRTVALKVLPSEIAADSDRRVRFEREARAVAALDHPHICAVYDVGNTAGTHFIVMPLLEGRDTRRPPPKRRPSPQRLAADCRRDRRRAGRGAPPGHHPSRHQAGQHHAHQVGSEAPRLRPGQDARRRRAGLHVGIDAGGHARAQNRARHDSRHGAVHGAGTGRGSRMPTGAPTSGRSAPSSSRWSPARDRSRVRRLPA